MADKYSDYVSDLNKAYGKDSVALMEFLKIDYIYDVAGYDHGFRLYQLMNRYSDIGSSNILHKLKGEELNNVRQYFGVGIDSSEEYKHEMEIHYPIAQTYCKY